MRSTPLVVLILALASSAQAFPRSPQVPVPGSSLPNLLNAQGQTIDVATQQQDAQTFAGLNVGIPVGLQFLIHPIGSPQGSLFLYDASDPGPAPAVFAIAPAAMLPGWFTTVRFDFSPLRIIVNVFDQNSTLQGTTVYPGAAAFLMGLAVAGPAAAFYSQDARNSDQRAHMLFYRGTGPHLSDAWLCVEDQAAEGGGDFNYSDDVYLLEFFAPVPVERSTWGALKQRFR